MAILQKMRITLISFPYPDKKCYVLSRTKNGKDQNIEYYSGEFKQLIESLKKQEGKNIYCDGGGMWSLNF